MIFGKPRLNITTYRAGMLQSQAFRALSNFLSDNLRPHGISITGWAALGMLNDENEMRISELATMLNVKPPVATTLARDLEARGFVERLPFTGDNRVTILRLTPPGADLVHELEKSIRHDMRQYLGDISISELIVYMRVLKKLAAKL